LPILVIYSDSVLHKRLYYFSEVLKAVNFLEKVKVIGVELIEKVRPQ
jgi:hypothetical protein